MAKAYKGYMIDLDGTMYLGNKKIDAAGPFIQRLRDKQKQLIFLTNNSMNEPHDVSSKLNRLGVEAYDDEILTSSLVLIHYLKENEITRVFAIGRGGVHQALDTSSIQLVDYDDNPQAVVVGLDTEVTYADLNKANLAIRKGALFISTNPDASLPTENGKIPGSGALAAFLETATGQKPVYMGKPSSQMMNTAVQRMGLQKEELIMVGDNYHTDILAGINNGIDSLMVFTGLSSKESLKAYEKQPSYTVESLAEWQVE